MKLFIFVKQGSVPDQMLPQAAVYAGLGCFYKFRETDEVDEWLKSGGEEVVCVVDGMVMEKARGLRGNASISADGKEFGLAFLPCGPKSPQGQELAKLAQTAMGTMASKNPILFFKDAWERGLSGDARDNNVIVGITIGRSLEKVQLVMNTPGSRELFERVIGEPWEKWYQETWPQWFMQTADYVQRIANQGKTEEKGKIITKF